MLTFAWHIACKVNKSDYICYVYHNYLNIFINISKNPEKKHKQNFRAPKGWLGDTVEVPCLHGNIRAEHQTSLVLFSALDLLFLFFYIFMHE